MMDRGGHDHKSVRPHILILTVLITVTHLEKPSQCRGREDKRLKEEPLGTELLTELGLRADAGLMDTN